MENAGIEKLLIQVAKTGCSVIDPIIDQSRYVPLDLSVNNSSLNQLDLSTSSEMTGYIASLLAQKKAKVGFGGYLEHRAIYRRSSNFNNMNPEDERNIHLGMDLWVEAGTAVVAALEGRVHSFQDNAALGDYGPTIILEHDIKGNTFYTLYGHLSRESLLGIEQGQFVSGGEQIASLGQPFENGDYAPHLHFQIIIDLEGKSGDYSGVCSKKELAYYKANCPDPALLLFD
jgi:murein DD-endopeptidase MepM/ murein hydrolase activator NlpD